MKPQDENRVWIVTGGVGAMAIGIALIPLRSLTSASNLAFAFVAYTVIVAEFGGRTAALVTAIVSAITLNFFLTEPYLTLAINKLDDLVAFFALAACGLIAAAFGRRREHWSDVAGRAGDELAILKRFMETVADSAPLEEVLGNLKQSFGLSAIVLRDEDERILAKVPADWTPLSIPEALLSPDTLLPSDDARLRFGTRGLRLPAGGGRLSLRGADGPVSMDVWEGDTKGFDTLDARALTIAASIIARELSRRRAA